MKINFCVYYENHCGKEEKRRTEKNSIVSNNIKKNLN